MYRVSGCKLLMVIALLTGTLVVPRPHAVQAESSKTSVQPLVIFGGGPVIPGTGSILVRTKGGVGMTLHAFGLTPGNVYTVWWAVFNNPKECATTPCTVADLPNPFVRAVLLWGSGQIAAEDGTADFGAYRAVQDPTASVLVGSAMALEEPLKAEIHLVVRSHGAADPDPAVLQAQLSTFNGGCPPNTCQNVQTAPHQP